MNLDGRSRLLQLAPKVVDVDRDRVGFDQIIDAVRSGRRDVLTADIEEGHLSSALCHLGNIAYRSRRTIHFEPATQKILGDEEASLLLTRQYRSPFEVRALV